MDPGDWQIVLSDEVDRWWGTLSPADTDRARVAINRLRTLGPRLRMPHSRQLSHSLWELRFRCDNAHQRITYTIDADRRIVTLTRFRKQRNNERNEVRRAQGALTRFQEGEHR
ncbi:type II toxin-antitoxin system RelE/ParE family toxin [Gordonia malaquae]|uniref:type II toxin-antitoxin system RelE/ParE family toxin n=1 Tax=Gordonia malaquae TaxID=410332 RepID=UPI0030FEE2B5